MPAPGEGHGALRGLAGAGRIARQRAHAAPASPISTAGHKKRRGMDPRLLQSGCGGVAYAASCASSFSATGPLSKPLAAGSRSISSMTAIGAMSP